MPDQHGKAHLRQRPCSRLPTALRLSTHRVTLRPSPPEGDVASATPDEPVRSRRGGVAFLITDHGHVVGNASSAALTGDRSITGLSADMVAELVAALSPLRHERHQARRASLPRKRTVSADAKHWLVFTDRPPRPPPTGDHARRVGLLVRCRLQGDVGAATRGTHLESDPGRARYRSLGDLM